MSNKESIVDWAEDDIDPLDFDNFDDYYDAIFEEWGGATPLDEVLGDELDDFRDEMQDHFESFNGEPEIIEFDEDSLAQPEPTS
jgi:hypothetical protein